jgi:hypothetical protein
MSKANVKRNDKGHGADFINQQRARDEAKNEKLKAQLETDKLDPEQTNRGNSRNDSSDVSRKGIGSGTHNTTGD